MGTRLPARPAVAIVGSRRSSITGNEIAHELARGLAERGVMVVSGLARGIDAAAHRGALAGGGATVAVLGCGIDVCYPQEHAALRDRIRLSGSVITEYEAGDQPMPFRFPDRNRIIAALCCAVIVVEATVRSGALSTSRHAADLGRDVLAVPGSIRSDRSGGTNQLIRDGAIPLLELADVFHNVRELAIIADDPALFAPADHVGPGRMSPSNPDHRRLLDAVGGDPVHPDSIGMRLGLPAAVVASHLSALELLGHLRTVAGGLIVRT